MIDFLTHLLNIPITQLAGFVALWGVAERVGIPVNSTFTKVLKLEKPSGAQPKDDQCKEKEGAIDELFGHADVANREMGEVKTSIGNIEKSVENLFAGQKQLGEDVAYIKGKLSVVKHL